MTSPLKVASLPGGWPDDAPARSVCFGLSPEGFSGDTLEDNASFFRRLSAQHGMRPWTLAFHAITPLLNQRSFKVRSDSAEDCYGLSIIGVSPLAGRWVDALEILTLRHDLEFRTLRPLRNIVSSFRLVASHERFCPACYAEDESLGRPKYNRLLWAFDCVKVCPRHGLLLKDVPTPTVKGGHAFWLPGISRVDGTSLVHEVTEEGCPYERKLAWLVVDLLEDCHLRPNQFLHSSEVPLFLRHAVGTLFGGVAAHFAAQLGVSKGGLHGWMTGQSRPSLHWVARTAYCCNCSIGDVLLGRRPGLSWRPFPNKAAPHLIQRHRNGAETLVPEQLLLRLDDLIATDAVRSVQEAADALNVSRKYLRKIAPAQMSRLAVSGKKRRTSAAVARHEADFNEYWNSFAKLEKARTRPARRKVLADVKERTGRTFSYTDAQRYHRMAQEEGARLRKDAGIG